MELKKSTIPTNTTTRTLDQFNAQTGNIYETVLAISKRANIINTELKQELSRKLNEFVPFTDNLEETFENREQIELSRYYERLPKSTLIAIEEYLDGDLIITRKNATAEEIAAIPSK